MTQRLYDENPFLQEFEATVLQVAEEDGVPRVVLDRTAFYPGGGGQPSDRGTLGAARVLDVQERGGGLWHLLDRPLPAGARLRGAIDWQRRFDHMQQHTGQHVLSQAFIGVAAAETVSFHMGEAASTIDVAHPGPDPALLALVEDRANEVLWEDRPVITHRVTRGDLARFPLRKPPVAEGVIRIVEVEGFDWSPCGGTHVGRSGQVGVIALLGAERYKGGTRIEFVCGGRALRRQRERSRLLRTLGLAFTAGEADLPAAVERLKEERDRLGRRLRALLKDALERESETLAAESTPGGRGPVVVRHFPDRDAGEVAALAALTAGRGAVALFFSGEEAPRAHFSAPPGTIPVGELLARICRRHGGKGGGRAESAQGAVPRDQLAGALETARHLALTGTWEGSPA
ncbi:MAG TPA: alanyl-tRNA editing protein [Candidatus Eisenbacteria bacterium]